MLAADSEMPIQPLTEFRNPIEWREDPGALQAWTDGETGFPIVDHAERREQAIAAFGRARDDE